MNSKKTIISLNVGKHLGGTERVMFDLINNIDRNRYNNVLVCCKNSLIYNQASRNKPQKEIVTVNSNRLLMLLNLFKLVRYSKKNKVQIIHCHGVLGSILGSLTGFISKVKVVTTIHSSTEDDFQNQYKGRLYLWVENHLLKYNAKYIAVSKYLEKQLIQRGLDRNKIICIHNGINYAEVADCKDDIIQDIQEKEKKNLFKIVCIGRLEYVKGQDILIDALAKYKIINKEFYCWIIGEGSTRESLEVKIKENSLINNVMIAGYKTCIAEILEKVDLVIVPSRMEALSLVAIEALQHKCIVVATDAGGVSDVIEDKITGFLYHNEDIEDMKDKIKYIHEHVAEIEVVKNQGFKKAIAEFSVINMIKQYEKVYEKVIRNDANLRR